MLWFSRECLIFSVSNRHGGEMIQQQPHIPRPVTSLTEAVENIFMCVMNRADFRKVEWSLHREELAVKLQFKLPDVAEETIHVKCERSPSVSPVSPWQGRLRQGSLLPTTLSWTINQQSSPSAVPPQNACGTGAHGHTESSDIVVDNRHEGGEDLLELEGPDQCCISTCTASWDKRSTGHKDLPDFASEEFLAELVGAEFEMLDCLPGLKCPKLLAKQEKQDMQGSRFKIKYGLSPKIFTFPSVQGNKSLNTLLKIIHMKSGKPKTKNPKLQAVTRIGEKHYHITHSVLLPHLLAFVNQMGKEVPFKITVVKYHKSKFFVYDSDSNWTHSDGHWFKIKMLSYQYRKSHCADKMIIRLFISTIGFPILIRWHFLYWISPPGHTDNISLCFATLTQQSSPHDYLLYPLLNEVEAGYTGFTLSVCPSVDRIVSTLHHLQ